MTHNRFSFLVIAAMLLLCWPFAARQALASQEAVATVSRTQGEVRASLEGEVRDLAPGDALRFGETVLTGPQGRLEAIFSDGTVLTLGGETEFVVDAYVYNADAGRGEALFSMAAGVFRVVTGKMTANQGGSLEVRTPLASIGIRGTDFWGGYFSPAEMGVLLVSGKRVEVRNAAGVSVLTLPGDGVTLVAADQAPGPVKRWPEAKVKRAVDSVTFR